MPSPLSTRRGRVPAWWSDAKLGIFVHWVPASVPGFAPTHHSITELLVSDVPDPISETPYSEWYQNSLRFPDSSVARFHRDRYGDRPYEGFANDFVAGCATWDPADWARRFAATGAGYVVLVAKHHDGWCLWPSDVPNPHRPGWHSPRDLVGELADVVRAAGMRFGLYYSGGYDWTFDATPIGTLADGLTAIPRGTYVDYATAQVRELIDRYRPAVLWNDIAWPSGQRSLERLLAHYFEVVPDGVVNDRWATSPDLTPLLRIPGVRRTVDGVARRSIRRRGLVPPTPRFYGFRTPEFRSPGDLDAGSIDSRPWETTRGMDRGFGFNRTSTEADFLTRQDLLNTLIDTICTGGNLLLNVGPRGEDATIPDEQVQRLDWMAEWHRSGGSALVGTRPWVRSEAACPEGVQLRFAAHADRVIVVVGDGSDAPLPARITLPLRATPATRVLTPDGAELPCTPATHTPATRTPATRTPVTHTPATHTPATHTPATPGTGSAAGRGLIVDLPDTTATSRPSPTVLVVVASEL